jgi:hypothetical protein
MVSSQEIEPSDDVTDMDGVNDRPVILCNPAPCSFAAWQMGFQQVSDVIGIGVAMGGGGLPYYSSQNNLFNEFNDKTKTLWGCLKRK